MFDPADRVPALGALRTAVHARDWAAITAHFDATAEEDDRPADCRVIAETPGAETFLREVVRQRPRDPLARTLLADRTIQIGWGIRTAAGAQHVSRAQFDQFFAHLRVAEQLLIEVCAEYPQYSLAWYLRVITARGLELGSSETRRRYQRLAEHHPHHLPGQMQLLQQLCPKWSGSWEAAHGFAQEATAEAPEGAPAGALVAIVQMEQYLELRKKENDTAAAGYLREPGNHARLLDAARRSVLHPAFRTGGAPAVAAHSAFAAAHSAAGRPADAAPHFHALLALGNAASEVPWGYLGQYDHEAEFVRHRKLALAAVPAARD
ncbi:hypothetical protein GPJ59_05865 [Streptomyces bambusae]|uniref:DUF4034 domain-containing protein n=1 Tax=Streptomyces bambusae TaxID=1550616 RepID=A0ABS6Z100_9ACTN|nr:hypothetical protein [Streptomyces bambusae]